MTTIDDRDRERARALMMAALDGEISAGDRQWLEALLAGSPDLDSEWRRLRRVKEVTADMTLHNPPEEVWDGYWVSVYRRAERGVAWILLSTSAIVLATYGLWHAVGNLLSDTALPAFVRVAIVGATVGAAILLLSVAREKLFAWRRDPYKEIVR